MCAAVANVSGTWRFSVQGSPVLEAGETGLDEIVELVEGIKVLGHLPLGLTRRASGFALFPLPLADDRGQTCDRKSLLCRCKHPPQGIALHGKKSASLPLEQRCELGCQHRHKPDAADCSIHPLLAR